MLAIALIWMMLPITFLLLKLLDWLVQFALDLVFEIGDWRKRRARRKEWAKIIHPASWSKTAERVGAGR